MTSRSEKKISYGRNILILLLLMAATFAVIFRGDDFPAFLVGPERCRRPLAAARPPVYVSFRRL